MINNRSILTDTPLLTASAAVHLLEGIGDGLRSASIYISNQLNDPTAVQIFIGLAERIQSIPPNVNGPVITCDVNNDQSVDIKDVVLSLQIASENFDQMSIVNQQSDVNGDQKIGLVEALYILQILAVLRENPALKIDKDCDGCREL